MGSKSALHETNQKQFAATQQMMPRFYGAMPAQETDQKEGPPTKVDGYVLHPTTLNENLLKAQYAVRGELYNKAQEMAAEGKDIIYTNGAFCCLLGRTTTITTITLRPGW